MGQVFGRERCRCARFRERTAIFTAMLAETRFVMGQFNHGIMRVINVVYSAVCL